MKGLMYRQTTYIEFEERQRIRKWDEFIWRSLWFEWRVWRIDKERVVLDRD